MDALQNGPFENLTAYTEVLQDGMLNLIKSGKMEFASATALSLSPEAAQEFNRDVGALPREGDAAAAGDQQSSGDHPPLGVIAMNGLIEADIYGNVNSTHIRGTSIMNGIGGSGDFARNAYLSIFMTPSTAKNGAISCIVPMVTHVDHTEHDVQVIVTEQGLADLRGLSPKRRAEVVIANCAHPTYRPALDEYFERALREFARPPHAAPPQRGLQLPARLDGPACGGGRPAEGVCRVTLDEPLRIEPRALRGAGHRRSRIATANFCMSRVNSDTSSGGQSRKIERNMSSRAASIRSLIVLPSAVTTARRARRSPGLSTRLTRPRLSSLPSWRLTVVWSRFTPAASSTTPIGPKRSMPIKQRKQGAVEPNAGRRDQRFVALRLVHDAHDLDQGHVKRAVLRGHMCILHVFH